jgi:hypothetical protein
MADSGFVSESPAALRVNGATRPLTSSEKDPFGLTGALTWRWGTEESPTDSDEAPPGDTTPEMVEF